MDSIIERFCDYGFRRGGILFFTPEKAIAVVKALDQAQVGVLGLDAFRITETETQPLMEESIDLSSAIGSSWREAITYLRERTSSGLLFEIIADE